MVYSSSPSAPPAGMVMRRATTRHIVLLERAVVGHRSEGEGPALYNGGGEGPALYNGGPGRADKARRRGGVVPVHRDTGEVRDGDAIGGAGRGDGEHEQHAEVCAAGGDWRSPEHTLQRSREPLMRSSEPGRQETDLNLVS
jgi:hypothetical protein